MYIGLLVKYRYCCQILIKLEFSQQIFEKSSNKNFMKIRQVGRELFHAGGRTDRQVDRLRQTDMKTLIVDFRNFANLPRSQSVNAVQ
jgi:hypothetical protein